MSFSSFSELSRAFDVAAIGVDVHMREAMKESCKLVEDSAKEAIGTYMFNWPQLAQSTQDDRVSKGFSANEPLLRTGELRDSIQHTVVSGILSGIVGYIGTNDPVAKYQEYGTTKIPPRPFLGGAVEAKGEEIAACFGSRAIKALRGDRD